MEGLSEESEVETTQVDMETWKTGCQAAVIQTEDRELRHWSHAYMETGEPG
jgi:hypothetical protein